MLDRASCSYRDLSPSWISAASLQCSECVTGAWDREAVPCRQYQLVRGPVKSRPPLSPQACHPSCGSPHRQTSDGGIVCHRSRLEEPSNHCGYTRPSPC
eukprot:3233365-Pyramimonas_sp.AAC.1